MAFAKGRWPYKKGMIPPRSERDIGNIQISEKITCDVKQKEVHEIKISQNRGKPTL